jgi:putative aldouronate transport system permease protein
VLNVSNITTTQKRNLMAQIWQNRFTYLLLVPGVISALVFAYWPMYGILLAFKKYNMRLGILNSPWADNHGLYYFYSIFRDPVFFGVIKNTLIFSVGGILIMTPTCIGLALLLNELRSDGYKKVVQSLMYLPHFLSWVILGGIIYNLFSATGGVYGKIWVQVTGNRAPLILTNPAYFRPLVFISDIWKEAGWGTIIYLAAIAGINPELYESALMDGATRLQRMWYITLPSIKSTVVILMVLNIGGLMNAGFDKIFNLYSPQVMDVGDIIDTFVYRHGLESNQYELSTAVGLFKQVINIILLLIANTSAKLLGEEGIY